MIAYAREFILMMLFPFYPEYATWLAAPILFGIGRVVGDRFGTTPNRRSANPTLKILSSLLFVGAVIQPYFVLRWNSANLIGIVMTLLPTLVSFGVIGFGYRRWAGEPLGARIMATLQLVTLYFAVSFDPMAIDLSQKLFYIALLVPGILYFGWIGAATVKKPSPRGHPHD